ncbi:MAG: hypothetical protein NVS3B21_31110 [Acidimicrobiales bacterium]
MGGPSGTVTFLFTDIEGSTTLWEDAVGEMAEALERHDSLLRSVIAEHEGYVFSTGGDGFGCAFPRAIDALAAAVEMQRELGEQEGTERLALRVRMGLHTGTSVERGGDYFGPSVIRAARLMSLVDGGRIVCSAATADALGPSLFQGLVLLPVGTAQLKGLAEPEQVFAVSGPGLRETGMRVASNPIIGHGPPRAPTRLVGRDTEVESICSMLEGSRLVTLTGGGGVGKTRLAIAGAEAAADRFPEGVVWVELSSLSAGSDVVQAVADAVGVSSAPGEALLERLIAALGGRRLLVILDNCEHVLDAAGALATELVATVGDLVILGTSRERLGPVGERIVQVRPLSAEGSDGPAVELLAERIGGDGRGAGAERGALLELAQRLDGLPLALELAAARCRTLGVDDVVDRLRDHLGLLADDNRPILRHRTLGAALSWSYDLLTESEQRVFVALSVFSAGFDLAAAEAVAGGADFGTDEVDNVVASLVEKSLIVRDKNRLGLLVTTREFGARLLADSPHHADVLAAHTRYVLGQLHLVHDGLMSESEEWWRWRLGELWADLRGAVRRALESDDADTAILLVVLIEHEAFWRRPEAFGWITQATERYGTRAGPHRHELLAAGSTAAWLDGDIPRAVELAEMSLDVNPFPAAAIDCLPELAAVAAYIYTGRFEQAAECARRALSAVSAGKDLYMESHLLSTLCLSLALGGSGAAESDESSTKALRLARILGNPTNISYAMLTKAVALLARDPTAAVNLAEEARVTAASVDNQWLLFTTTTLIAMLPPPEGGQDALSAMLEAVAALYRAGWVPHAWTALRSAIHLLFELGRFSDAALVLGGCEAAGIGSFATNGLPSELERLVEAGGDRALREQRNLGARLSVPELLRVVTQPRNDQTGT